MARRILITGGCGFIGVNFVRFWRAKYPEDFIINLDKLTYAGVRESQADFEGQPFYSFIQGDLADWEFVEHLFTGMYEVCPKPDLIVHFAAESHVDRSISGPRPFIESNIIGTFNLLEAARLYGNVRFHHVSTDEVYGELKTKNEKRKTKKNANLAEDTFSETSSYQPRSPYSASKAAADHLVRAYFHTYELPVTISNCSNNYGPYQYPEKLLSLAITNLLRGRKVPLYGDGLHVREWLHVQDHCEAIDRIIALGKIGETYMVGSRVEKPNREVLDFVLAEMGFGEEMIEYVEDRKGHDRRYSVDASKIEKELGWKARIGFEEGVMGMVDWYRKNEGWWRGLVMGDGRKVRSLRLFGKKSNVAFIDGQNIHMGVKRLGWELDLHRFRTYLKQKYDVRDAYYFIGCLPGYQKLYRLIEEAGFILVQKPSIVDRFGVVKGNCDADLILKALQVHSLYDGVVLASGDGDFYSLVRYFVELKKLRAVLSPSFEASSYLLRREALGKVTFFSGMERKLSVQSERASLEDRTSRQTLSSDV